MDIIKVIILSLVEGLTEFLPVSSTGHLILLNPYIEFNQNFKNTFDIVIQFGAILSVIVLYFNKLNIFTKDKIHNKETLDLWKKVVVGVLPAVVLGLLFGDIIEEKFFNRLTVCIMLFIGGIVIIIMENKSKDIKIKNFGDLSYKMAIAIGFFQCMAMIPGTSRSAATIIGAMLLGCSRVIAAEFSFFLAIPTMAGATTYKLLKSGISLSSYEWSLLALGTFLSFVFALIVIKLFMGYVKKKDFKIFGFYRIILSGIILLSMLLKF
jgi:undecaprenyl-diphosphatase